MHGSIYDVLRQSHKKPHVQSYMSCVQNMKEIGLEDAVPKHVPTHGIGHSNGALMHLLIGSLVQSPYTSNVLMSYNNKEVADAIPIPGALPDHSPPWHAGITRGSAELCRCLHTYAVS